MAQKKRATKKNATKKKAKANKKTAKKAPKKSVELNSNQANTLKGLSKTFAHSGAHRMTQQSLIDKGLAVTDKTGTKIKSTGLGRKVAKKV